MSASIVVVTGVSGFLGAEVAKVLAAAGHRVIGLERKSESRHREGLELALGGVDLLDEASVVRAFTTIREKFDHIDALINVAGGFRWETIGDGSVATWDSLYQTNVRTALIVSRAALPYFPNTGGAIVNIGGNAAQKAGLGMGAYAAAKAGVARLTEALAEELKDKLIRVNAILPTIIDTPVNRSDMPDAQFDRWVTPTSLAEVIGFLISLGARDITGALIPVTGRV